MTNTRVFLPPGKSSVASFRSRLFAASEGNPRTVTTPVRSDQGAQYPVVEGMLNESKTQPYIHDCIVNVIEGRFLYRYHLFFKRHCMLSHNKILQKICGGSATQFRGDILIMRLSLKNNAYVHLRERDVLLSNFLVQQFAMHMRGKQLKCLPKVLNFAKSSNPRIRRTGRPSVFL